MLARLLTLATMAVAVTQPMPFDEAVRRIAGKTAIATPLSSAEMQDLAIGLRERAFWSAKVTDIRTAVSMQANLQEAVDLSSRDAGRAFMDRDKFIRDMRGQLGAVPGDSGDLTDITSSRRLGLVYDFNVEDAMEFGRWKVGQDPELLDAAPCQELVRIEARVDERPWEQIWKDAGGTLYDGRMIARKDDPIWIRISDFGRPWPPFKYGSGMGVEDVFRDEAEELGVIRPDDVIAPQERDFNTGLEASIPDASPAMLESFKQLFGDQVDVGAGGKITWQGDRIANLYEQALAKPGSSWSIDLGEATDDTVATAETAGADLAGARLQLSADAVRQAARSTISARDMKLVPHVWRGPDAIEPGDKPGSLVLTKRLIGREVAVTYDRIANTRNWSVRALDLRDVDAAA